MGRSGNSEIPDRLGFSRHMKTRLIKLLQVYEHDFITAAASCKFTGNSAIATVSEHLQLSMIDCKCSCAQFENKSLLKRLLSSNVNGQFPVTVCFLKTSVLSSLSNRFPEFFRSTKLFGLARVFLYNLLSFHTNILGIADTLQFNFATSYKRKQSSFRFPFITSHNHHSSFAVL